MASRSELEALRHFDYAEWHHPEQVAIEAARYLDEIRHRFAAPLWITDDARMPEDHPSGASPSSLHYAGRAFDLQWIHPATQLARFVESVVVVSGEWGVDYELELVNSAKDRHVHLGLQRPGHPSEVIVSAD